MSSVDFQSALELTSPPGSRKQSRQLTHLSSQSGRVSFPTSAKSAATSMSNKKLSLFEEEDYDDNKNPFKLPADNDIFMLRDKERRQKKIEREKLKLLKVHEKTTYPARVNAKAAALRREILKEPAVTFQEGDSQDADFTLNATKERRIDKESVTQFVEKKREMFLVQYSLGVKRDEMRKLEDLATAEERKLEMAEKYLEDDATLFDEFLQENDKNSVDAIKIDNDGGLRTPSRT